jgi:hypothetical protein
MLLHLLVPVFALAAGIIYLIYGDKTYSDPYLRGIHHTIWIVLVLVSLITAAHHLRVTNIVKVGIVRRAVILSMPIIAAVGASMVIIADTDEIAKNTGTKVAGHVWIALHGILVALFVTLPPKALLAAVRNAVRKAT